jgi:hypothetical protein
MFHIKYIKKATKWLKGRKIILSSSTKGKATLYPAKNIVEFKIFSKQGRLLY